MHMDGTSAEITQRKSELVDKFYHDCVIRHLQNCGKLHKIICECITASESKSFGSVHTMFKKMGNMGIKAYEILYNSYDFHELFKSCMGIR